MGRGLDGGAAGLACGRASGGEPARGRLPVWLGGLIAAAPVAFPATAQVAAPLPPGALTRPPTAQELDRAPAPPAPMVPRATVRSRLAPGPCPDAIANSTLTTPLKGVAFSGPGGAPLPPAVAAVLDGVGRDLDGQARPLADVCRLRDEASAALARARFIAVVQVPEQQLADGVLQLRVTTARITELRVRGAPGGAQDRLQGLLSRLQELVPLNEADAERILLLANDIPGTQVALELRPSPTGAAGEVIGEIQIERRRGSLVANFQNYGSEQIGRMSAVIRGDLYDITGLADRTYASIFSTTDGRELVVGQLGHDFALGNNGLRLAANTTYAITRPTLANATPGFNLKSESVLASVFASYPLRRTTSTNLRVAGGLDLIEQRTRALDTEINLDKIRTLWARVEGDAAQRRISVLPPGWRVGAQIELRQGLAIFGSTPVGGAAGLATPTRFEGNSRALVVRGGVNGEVRQYVGKGGWAVTLAADGRGQWTADPLLAFDEFAVGNLTIGRGYDPGATAGDRFVGGSVELRAGKPAPVSARDIAIEAVGFYDHVQLWNLDSNNFESNRRLRSVGGGARIAWGSHARIDIVYARPLDRNLAIDRQKPGSRVLVNLTVRALPWR